MGMFDWVICEYELPPLVQNCPYILESARNNVSFQSKNTPAQFTELYKIDKKGFLFVETYDIEDHSNPNASGIYKLFGKMTRVNPRWNFCDDFSDRINFYNAIEFPYPLLNNKKSFRSFRHMYWVEFKATFKNGQLSTDIELVDFHRRIYKE